MSDGLTPAEQREVSDLLKELHLPDLSTVVNSPVIPQRAKRPTAGTIVQTEIERRWNATRPKKDQKPVKHPGREALGPKGWME